MAIGTRPSAEEVKATLGLKPHPTCGFVAETYRSPLKVPAGALPEAYDGGDRPYGSALYFLVAPDAQIVLHRIRSDQLYHHYLGDPLEVLMLYPDGTGAVSVVGSDGSRGAPAVVRAGEHLPHLAPGARWHRLRPAGEHGVARGGASRRRARGRRGAGSGLPRLPRTDAHLHELSGYSPPRPRTKSPLAARTFGERTFCPLG